MSRTALITGVAGLDGAGLAELLLQQGYAIQGVKRRASSVGTKRIHHICGDPHLPGGASFCTRTT